MSRLSSKEDRKRKARALKDTEDTEDTEDTQIKKKKVTIGHKLWNKWFNLDKIQTPSTKDISGTDVKNYLLNDRILDVIKYQHGHHNTQSTQSSHSTRSEYSYSMNKLFELGNNYEKEVLEHLNTKFNVVTINLDGKVGYTQANVQKTIDAINSGCEIIYQGVLRSEQYHIVGSPDLIVRGDILSKLTQESYPISKDMYVIVDIKCTTMSLCAKGSLLRNDRLMPAYKGQLAIYTFLLGLITGNFSSTAYILGKNWKTDHATGTGAYEKLGIIDYNDFDNKYVDKTYDAIVWLHDVQKGHYDPYNPTSVELYPNCCNNFDQPYTEEKKKIAIELNELTRLWYVGYTNRLKAFEKGIKSWKDDNCRSDIMGINGHRGKVIDKIIEINAIKDSLFTRSPYTSNINNWQTESSTDFYIDFETIDWCEMNIIFMIGIGYATYVNGERVWTFKNLVAKEATDEEEKRIYRELMSFLPQSAKLFHWSNAEISILKRLDTKYPNISRDDLICMMFLLLNLL